MSINDIERTVAFTGHRPDKLFGYKLSNTGNLKILKRLRAVIVRHIEDNDIHTFISGMALGIDMWSAMIVLSLRDSKYPHIKLVCAVPCIEQYKKWNEDDIETYKIILSQADKVVYVSDEPYTNWCMIVRDKWMVDHAGHILAVWDGYKDGGTWITVEYALKKEKPIIQLHPKNLKISWSNY